MGTWEPGRLAVLVICIFLLLFSILVFRDGIRYRRTAARHNRQTQDFFSRAVRARAVVVGVEEESERLLLSTIRHKYRDFLPVVQFQTWQGQPVRTRTEIGVERNPPHIGQQVEICYDAAWPQRVRLTGPGMYPPRIVRRGVSGVFMLVRAVLMLVCGLFGTLGVIFIPD